MTVEQVMQIIQLLNQSGGLLEFLHKSLAMIVALTSLGALIYFIHIERQDRKQKSQGQSPIKRLTRKRVGGDSED